MEYAINTNQSVEIEDDNSSESEDSLYGGNSNEESFPYGDTNVLIKSSSPKDRYKAAYFVFYLLGILTLLPWNFFVTANEYWMYKFRNLNETYPSQNKTELQAEFTSYLSIAATGPSVLFLILNSLFSHRISIQFRMVGSLVLIFICFLVTNAFVEVNTDSWQHLFFALNLAIVVIVNIFSALFQAALMGIASKFPTRYITAMISGQALGGMFSSAVYIVSLAVGASATHSAFLYFVIANVTILLSLVSYILLSRTIFFKYHMMKKSPANTLQYDPAEVNSGETSYQPQSVPLMRVFYKTWIYGMALFMCFTVTISVYPAVTVLVVSESQKSEWNVKYFVPVVAFLIFSIWDYIGRILAGYLKWPMRRKFLILGFSFVRIVFIPLILLCNAQPRHLLPVILDNDSYYIALTCLFAFSNGYLMNITMINVPRDVEEEEQEAASSMMIMFLGFGCAAGSFLSFLVLQIL
ncbi:UNVERIFIED_CONTAM: hypothetical protein PYX00_009441 [Menopon gallinae]|uniref:Equilibrative nucleoside transporter 3 n=1 Tax=Menopon gallinae TaxID=328185 RepID=A0AAW2HB82_9NEOP